MLDTHIILYAAVYNHDIALELIAENTIFISDITEIELLGYHRLYEKERHVIEELLSCMIIVPVSGGIKSRAIELRKEYALKTPDAIIAATALELGYFLASADKKLQKIENIEAIEFKAP